MKLVYSAVAVADLKRLRAFIAEHNPTAAARVASRLREQVERLEKFPRLGQAVQAAPDPETIRDVIFGDYVIRYSLHDDCLVVLKIWHGRENRPESAAPTDR
ncbi:MAG: type II toxin-antitoxin system RelE/ParE family toxin [Wenzhouxiangellaceae bacterium]|nr:type II toxin-antitoxin system RelE/ParE family toxin [Wenzhouxiangellaceae bacterium]